MAKIKKVTFLLADEFNEPLSLAKLEEASTKYMQLLEETNLLFHGKETLDIMLWAKREIISFGPYQNLTFFETSNRIYSDLVLLKAAAFIMKKKNVKSIQLNMGNKGGNDMTVIDDAGNVQIGETFNTAISFFQIKLRSELPKFPKEKRGYIAFNESALEDKGNRVFYNKKEKEFPHIEFIPCNI